MLLKFDHNNLLLVRTNEYFVKFNSLYGHKPFTSTRHLSWSLALQFCASQLSPSSVKCCEKCSADNNFSGQGVFPRWFGVQNIWRALDMKRFEAQGMPDAGSFPGMPGSATVNVFYQSSSILILFLRFSMCFFSPLFFWHSFHHNLLIFLISLLIRLLKLCYVSVACNTCTQFNLWNVLSYRS